MAAHHARRTDGDEFVLTQEFLGQMLGVTRASVNEVARELQQEGAIDYTRGRVTVLDRGELEARSCECYDVIARSSTGCSSTPADGLHLSSACMR